MGELLSTQLLRLAFLRIPSDCRLEATYLVSCCCLCIPSKSELPSRIPQRIVRFRSGGRSARLAGGDAQGRTTATWSAGLAVYRELGMQDDCRHRSGVGCWFGDQPTILAKQRQRFYAPALSLTATAIESTV